MLFKHFIYFFTLIKAGIGGVPNILGECVLSLRWVNLPPFILFRGEQENYVNFQHCCLRAASFLTSRLSSRLDDSWRSWGIGYCFAFFVYSEDHLSAACFPTNSTLGCSLAASLLVTIHLALEAAKGFRYTILEAAGAPVSYVKDVDWCLFQSPALFWLVFPLAWGYNVINSTL